MKSAASMAATLNTAATSEPLWRPWGEGHEASGGTIAEAGEHIVDAGDGTRRQDCDA
jgi:hypothetical protein